jgi:hypothetical protein
METIDQLRQRRRAAVLKAMAAALRRGGTPTRPLQIKEMLTPRKKTWSRSTWDPEGVRLRKYRRMLRRTFRVSWWDPPLLGGIFDWFLKE